MQFTHDHRCPHCQLSFDLATPHDHFLQYPQTSADKKQRIDSLTLILDRILSPSKLKKEIIYHISQYYKYSDNQDTTHPTKNDQEITSIYYIRDQTTIGLGHFIRRKFARSSFLVMTQYYKIDKVWRRFSARNWIKTIITSLLSIHISAWQSFCSKLHKVNTNTKLFQAKDIILHLVQKYYALAITLSRKK